MGRHACARYLPSRAKGSQGALVHAVQPTHNHSRYRPMRSLWLLSTRLVRARWRLLVYALLVLWCLSGASVVSGEGGRSTDPAQSWHLGEVTDLRSWYWGEPATVPQVEGGQCTCVDNGSNGLRCVIISQGVYRHLIVNGVTWEDRRYRLSLLQVNNG